MSTLINAPRTADGWLDVDNLTELFIRTPVDEHVPRDTTGDVWTRKEGSAMCVLEDENLPQVFRKLAIEGFLSAPVLDDQRKFVGFVDMLDLVRYTTDLFWGETEEAWIDFWDKQSTFLDATVSEVMQRSDTWEPKPLNTTMKDCSTFSALETLARTGAHRLAIIDNKRYVKGIITQSMIISMIRQNMHLLREFANKPISEFVGLWKPVSTIKDTDIAINAFNNMVQNNVSGLAIVDNNSKLTGAISIRDLRGVGSNGQRFSRLFQTVESFKRMTREEYPFQAPRTHYSRRNVPLTGLYVRPSATLQDVIRMMNDGCIHRIFVTSESGDMTPVNVISQCDVLLAILNNLKA